MLIEVKVTQWLIELLLKYTEIETVTAVSTGSVKGLRFRIGMLDLAICSSQFDSIGNIIVGSFGYVSYVIAKFFQGGYRTKMKNWSEKFSRASGTQKKGFRAFFVVEALKTTQKLLKTAKNS